MHERPIDAVLGQRQKESPQTLDYQVFINDGTGEPVSGPAKTELPARTASERREMFLRNAATMFQYRFAKHANLETLRKHLEQMCVDYTYHSLMVQRESKELS